MEEVIKATEEYPEQSSTQIGVISKTLLRLIWLHFLKGKINIVIIAMACYRIFSVKKHFFISILQVMPLLF